MALICVFAYERMVNRYNEKLIREKHYMCKNMILGHSFWRTTRIRT